MKVGVEIPLGLDGEYAGWEPAAAWDRVVGIARAADRLGFDTAWVFDHLGTFGTVRDELSFEAFATLGALIGVTRRIRLGTLVARAGLRNPALLAKHVATLDVASGGRMELGIGAGGTIGEALAFGYAVPDLACRMGILRDDLEVLRRMLRDGRATYTGAHAAVAGALNNPRGLQSPAIPLLVGGNSRMAMRMAATYAEELNLDGPDPARTAQVLPEVRRACEEIGGAQAHAAALNVVALEGRVADACNAA